MLAMAFERFVRIHMVGDVVSATVIRSRAKDGLALLECGAQAHIADCLDHEPGSKAQWIPVPVVGQRIQVYVRAIRRANHHILVSVHTFTVDMHFNLFNAGYRSSFDGSTASFALLPWERSRLVRDGRRR